jgi:plastocyanin
MRIFSRLLIVPVIAALAACGGGGDSTSPSNNSSTPVATNAVTVSNDIFTPPNVVVSAGTTVTWTWAAGALTHNVTFDDGSTSGDRAANGTPYTRTFATVGTFNFHCTIHPSMTGSVKVQ